MLLALVIALVAAVVALDMAIGRRRADDDYIENLITEIGWLETELAGQDLYWPVDADA